MAIFMDIATTSIDGIKELVSIALRTEDGYHFYGEFRETDDLIINRLGSVGIWGTKMLSGCKFRNQVFLDKLHPYLSITKKDGVDKSIVEMKGYSNQILFELNAWIKNIGQFDTDLKIFSTKYTMLQWNSLGHIITNHDYLRNLQIGDINDVIEIEPDYTNPLDNTYTMVHMHKLIRTNF